MRRPLYYVDLRGIETNAELKSILDHINSQPARGIIVFEDIDGATNVVHRRFDKKHQQPPINQQSLSIHQQSLSIHQQSLSINQQPPIYRRSDMQPTIATMQDMNSALTLDFFLNTLQGMLTRDESMVIVTTNHLEKLDGAFMRDGRFDVLIELHLCDHHQLKSMFRAVLDIELTEEHLRQLEEDKYTPGMVLALLERYSYEKQPVDVIIDELIERKKRFDELVNQTNDVDDFAS
jgi:SpoVK/Ycf46/Vps4 family AAA+-type ATPase